MKWLSSMMPTPPARLKKPGGRVNGAAVGHIFFRSLGGHKPEGATCLARSQFLHFIPEILVVTAFQS
jgi:hypothetical protein